MKINDVINESISELDNHQSIGVDIDQTLLEHPKSPILQNYIREHQEKTFILITFRFGRLAESIWPDVAMVNLGKEHFTSMYNLKKDQFLDWETYERLLRVRNPKKLERIIANENLDVEFLKSRHQELLEWKAMICEGTGCTILLDDMEELVIEGCKKYNIKYMHPVSL